MRSVLICLLICSAFGTATAEHRAPTPLPRVDVGVALIGFGTGAQANGVGGFGVNVELGISRGRWQMFGEAANVWGFHRQSDGMGGRLGAGARYLARSVEIDSSVALELFGEASIGVEGFGWRQGGQLVQPDFTIGGGTQVRFFRDRKFALHFGGRLVMTPAQKQTASAACRGPCGDTSSSAETGFMALVGVRW